MTAEILALLKNLGKLEGRLDPGKPVVVVDGRSTGGRAFGITQCRLEDFSQLAKDAGEDHLAEDAREVLGVAGRAVVLLLPDKTHCYAWMKTNRVGAS